ncbi:MAG: TonB-dependent receptor [Opitutus sp.]|nr:TonB-dependent receptor [Opitutus sp.]
MNKFESCRFRRWRLSVLPALSLLLSVAATPLFAQATRSAGLGTLSGQVLSADTHAPLRFAVVEVVGTDLQATTERDGNFQLRNVPAGAHQVQITYAGLEPQVQSIHIAADGDANLVVTLKASAAIMLEKLTVTGERSGIAAAIQQQRNALNSLSVITADQFGGVADGKIDDALKRIPGVGLSSTRFSIRGVPDTENSITIDGARMASASRAQGRNIETDRIPGDRVATIEVNKSLLPDMNADAIGGTINLVTKSAFDLPRGQLNYLVAGSGLKGLNDDPDAGYAAAIAYNNVYGVFGRQDNLGINLSLSRSDKPMIADHPSAGNEMINVFSNRALPGVPAPTGERMVDGVTFPITIRRIKRDENSNRTNFGLKLDYRFSPVSQVWFNTFHSKRTTELVQLNSRLQIPGTTIAPLAVNAQGDPVDPAAQGILPGFQSKGIIRWRNAQTQMDNDFLIDRSDVWLLQADGKHGFGNYKLAWNAAYSSDDNEFDHKLLAVTGRNTTHATIDRSNLLLPKITYTGGEAPLQYGLTNVATTVIQNQLFNSDNSLLTLKADLSRDFATRFPIQLKTGGQYRSQKVTNNPTSNQIHTYTGGTDVSKFATRPINPFGNFDDKVNVDPRKGAADLRANPQSWVFDAVGALRQSLQQDGDIKESISAAYLMGQVRVEKLMVSGGVRGERTEVEGRGFVFRGNIVGVPVEQQYKETRTKGDYDNLFPSIFARYQLRKNLQLRASYSNGIGRPGFNVLRPTTNVSTTPTATGAAGSINQPDPALKPQYVDNYDLALEYYFEPAGMLSLAVFRKEISNFHDQVTLRLDPSGGGFGAEFGNYDLVTRSNVGRAKVEGFEFAYQQQFVFLPGILSGLGGFANWTHLNAKLDAKLESLRTSDGLANHIPDTVNLGLSYQRAPLSIRVLGFWRSDYVLAFNNPRAVDFLRKKIFDMDVKLEYAFSKRLRVFCDIYNILRSSPLTSEGNRLDDHALRPAYIYKRPLQVELGIKGVW